MTCKFTTIQLQRQRCRRLHTYMHGAFFKVEENTFIFKTRLATPGVVIHDRRISSRLTYIGLDWTGRAH
jgi:hypothetical protein